MNPYAAYVGNRDPVEILSSTPGRLKELLNRLGAEGVQVSLSPGKWSVREIVCHLADTEIAHGFRMRQALAEARHIIQPFDQDRWAENYAGFNAHAALDVFAALRKWNAGLIAAIPSEALLKPLTHPERGEMTIRTLIETMAGHDLNHLQQIETIAGRTRATHP
ncbi:MAG: DinB family protein [Acidobacteriota bacterium]|nr:DinB family protein [Acidobacteriota bacterium]